VGLWATRKNDGPPEFPLVQNELGSITRDARPGSIEEQHMPLFIIERNFAEQLDLTDDDVVAVSKINGEVGVNWVFSFLSADKRKTYCLYEAKDPEAIREAARRANVPADNIVEVSQAFGTTIGGPPRLAQAAA
jgi:hypothetical protein